MTEDAGSERRGAWYVVAASVVFGTTGVFVHLLGHVPLPALIAYRVGLGAAVFGALALASPALRRALVPRREEWRYAAALGVLLVGVDALFFTAIVRIGVGLSAVLLYAAPIFVALGSWAFLSERPGRRALAGIALGFVGVVLIAKPDVSRGADLATLAGVGSGVGWAAWLLVSRAAGTRGASGESQAAGALWTGTLVAVPLALVLSPVLLAGRDLALASGLGVVAGSLSILLFARGLRLIPAPRAAVIGYLEPATAVALGALLLGERYGLQEAAGSALVLVGTALVTVRR